MGSSFSQLLDDIILNFNDFCFSLSYISETTYTC